MIRKILTSSLITLIAIGGFFVSIERGNVGNIQFVQVNTAMAGDVATPAPGSAVTPAAAPKTDPATDTDVKKMMNNLVAGLNIILGIVTFIASPAIMLAGWLMSPDWTSGDLFGLRTIMHSLWVTVSNILYFVYAVLLIIIALATMFNQEKFGYKVMLPKLALGIIMVPFTWWFVQWTISLASVVTASVISIPMETIAADNGWWNSQIIPTKIVYDNSSGTGKTESTKECGADFVGPHQEGVCTSPGAFLSKAGGQWGPLMIYAYGIFKFQEVKDLSTKMNVISTVGGLINQGIMAILMFLVFGILVLALIFMLAMRAIKLWMYAIFSPLFTLHFVVGKDLLGEKMDDFSLKEFIGLAFVPAVVGLVLSFGLVIIATIKTPSIDPTKGNCLEDQSKGCTMSILGNPDSTITSKLNKETKTSETEIKFGGVTYTYKGVTGKADGDMVAGAQSIFSTAGGMFGTIILDIIALVFVWASFMAAKNVSKAVKAAIDPFEQMGKKIGELGMSLPKYMPLPGIGMSANSMSRVAEMPQNILNKKEGERLGEIEGKLGKMFGTNVVYGEAERVKLSQAIQNGVDSSTLGTTIDTLNASRAKGLDVHGTEGKKFIDDTISIMQKTKPNYLQDRSLTEANIAKLKDENLSEDDKTILAARWLSKDSMMTDKDKAEKFLKSKEASSPSSTTGTAGTTNNTFNIVTEEKLGKTTYKLDSPILKIEEDSKEKLVSAIEKNLDKLTKVPDDVIKAQLKGVADEKKIEEILKKIEEKRKEEK